MNLQTNNQISAHMSKVHIGKLYKHYSGKTYKVLLLAHYSEDPTIIMVVYQGLYDCPTFGANAVWCRPYTMFTEMVAINGTLQRRFTEIE